jgi:eukaryotic-like serine/threonine-protein kinase
VSHPPPPSLVELLTRLELALPAQVASVSGRVRRLARDLPGFELVWVDALAQARILTALQAAEINAGRGARLQLGPYVLHQALESLGYATVYRAREIASRRWARLIVAPASAETADAWSAQMAGLVRRSAETRVAGILPVERFGRADDRFWIASPDVPARSAADWLLHHGRLPPEVVLQIARQMTAMLADCKAAGVVHGDLGPRQVLLTADGNIALPAPGVRAILRPAEGYAAADLMPEAYDYLAPERVAAGTAASGRTDVYACGALWWHFLAGRPPIPGATGLAKMRAVQTARIPDVAHLAPGTPPVLAQAIAACLARDPSQRPASLAALSELLGPPTREGQRTIAGCLKRAERFGPGLAAGIRRRPWSQRAPRWLAGTVGVALVLAVATWPQWGAQAVRRTAEARKPLPVRTPVVANAQNTPKTVAKPHMPGPVAGSHWDGTTLVLAAGSTIRAADLTLRDGQTLRSDGRATIELPSEGWKIAVENLHLENIDFSAAPAGGAMLTVQAARATFRGCCWQAPSGAATVGIRWQPPAVDADDTLASGQLELADCVFRQVAAAVDCQNQGTIGLDVQNTLHLGPGPLLRLARPPATDESLLLSVAHVTLRDAEALLQCSCDSIIPEPGRITIQALDCAFMPRADRGLLVFVGENEPSTVLQSLEWTGQGSVVARQAALAVWLDHSGRVRAAAEDQVDVAGLVRSDVGFAGDKDQGPAASRIVRWQVPLHSTDPPGIRESSPLPAQFR